MTQQFSLFGEPVAAPADEDTAPRLVTAAAHDQATVDLAASLPRSLHLGTSSWYFPGWNGIVFGEVCDAGRLSRDGLAAYSAHPLLRCVSIDRTYYAPMNAASLAAYASQVPDDFRFMVKAPSECTTPFLRGADGRAAGANPRYLDPVHATESFVVPTLAGLGGKCGPLIFQFPPQGHPILREPERFAEKLYAFLAGLPQGPLYAVELRDAGLFSRRYVQALRATRVRHCLSVHPRASPLADQLAALRVLEPGPLVARWNLNPAHQYQEAKERFSPFDRLMEEDPESRAALADACADALSANRPVFLIANNKAEGSAPLSIGKLAVAIDARLALPRG